MGIIAIILFTLASLIILISAYKSQIPRKIGFRNIRRRLGNTFLVVVGSMVGTALITGSLVLSDSLDQTFVKIVDDQLAEMDLLVSANELQPLGAPIPYLNSSEIEQIKTSLNTERVDGVAPLNILAVAPVKLDENDDPVVNAYQIALYGIDLEEYNSFGQHIKELAPFEKEDSIFVTEYLAVKLELEEGDTVGIPFGDSIIKTTVQKIYDRGYIPGDPVIIIDNEFLNRQIGLPPNAANSMSVSAAGGVQPDNYDGEEFLSYIEEQLSTFESSNTRLTYYEAKQQALDGFGMKIFADIFLVMSFFGIFAGSLLIINLYMMLASERKYEMGILRAIALTRTQLMKTFVYEGYLYSIFSSLLGIIIGVGIGYVMVYSLNSMLEDILGLVGQEGVLSIVFDANLDSIIIAFSAGAFITILTSVFASYKVSKLNIVEAIRDFEEEKKMKYSKKWVLTTVLLFILTVISLLSFLSFFSIRGSLEDMRAQDTNQFATMSQASFEETVHVLQAYSLYFGVVFTLIFGTFLFNRIIQLITKKDISSYTITVSSFIVILFTSLLSKVDSFIQAGQSQSSVPIFFVSGVVLVVSMSLIITYNLEFFTNALSVLLSPIKRLIPVVKISLRYPAVNRGRTGLTLIMFAIVIFLIVYTSMMKVTIRQINEQTLEQTLGGYDVLVLPSPQLLGNQLEGMQNDINSLEGIELTTNMTHTNVELPGFLYKDLEELPIYDNPYAYQHNDDDPYASRLDALPEDFIDNSNIELSERAEGYANDEEVWEAVKKDPTKVVLGASFVEVGYGKRPELKVGDRFTVSDIFQTRNINMEVVGIAASQGETGVSFNFSTGIITTDTNLKSIFEDEYINRYSQSEILVGFEEEVNVSEKSTEIRKAIINYDVVQVLELTELVRTGQSFIDSMILMFQGFLGFSLVVGASGLAIIVARSVQERRQQIGMLRSLGFQRNSILTGFFFEATFIAALGIIIGISMGTIGALNEFYITFHDQPDIRPAFAYKEVIIISLIVYTASILFSLVPSIKAARLSPVEATNYPE